MLGIVNSIKIINTIENWQDYFRWLVFLPPKDDFIKLRNGIKYKVRKHDSDKWVVDELWVHGIYNSRGFEIGKNDTVIDIGAHIGVFSVFAGSQAKEVIAFEPFHESYELLKENLELNNIANVKTVNLGVSEKREKCRIYLEENNSCCNSICKKSDKFTEIRCITLEDVFRDYKIKHCNYLKMDCEGSEYGILLNTPDKILKRIDRIVLEYHDGFVEGYSHEDLQGFFEKKGFDVILKPPMMYISRK